MIFIAAVIVLVLIGWAVWAGRQEQTITETTDSQPLPTLISGQPDYSGVVDLSDCQEVECALQMMDNNKIANFELKAWLRDYVEQNNEFSQCNWDWDLFEQRAEGLKEARRQLREQERRQSVGISCDFLQPVE